MTFRDLLRTRDIVLTGHVNMALAIDADSVIRQGEFPHPAVDAVQLADNASMQPRLRPLVCVSNRGQQ